MKRAFVLAVLLAGLLHAVVGAQETSTLKFFKNYFVTGDVVAAGTGLRGLGVNGIATGSITISLPEGADEILSAQLYTQVVLKDVNNPNAGSMGTTFNGYPLSSADGPFGKVLSPGGTATCWASGGGGGGAEGNRRTFTYRYDVARFFDTDESTGKPKLNVPLQVQVPDDGNDKIALGAGLVVVYSDSDLPLSAIISYDGGITIDNGHPTWFQSLAGFYQPSNVPDGKAIFLVGSSQSNKRENVYFNGQLLAPDPFGAFDGESWDTRTFPVSLGSDPTSVSQVTVGIDTVGVSGPDCNTVAGVWFKTRVLDQDEDGLLDIWESSVTPLYDPNGHELPNLNAMGADPLHKDVFVEIGYMKTDVPLTYSGVLKPAHTHLPPHAAIKLVGDALKNSPVGNPDGNTGIRLHVDAGSSYPPGDPVDPSKNAEEYIVRDGAVPGLARGGEFIDETMTTLDPVTNLPCVRGATDPPEKCQFSDPGTLGWKTGFRFFKDELVSATPPALTAAGEDPCDWPKNPLTGEPNTGPGGACERRFDLVRKDTHRYAVFAHGIGLPKSLYPCLIDGVPGPVDSTTGRCDPTGVDNPDFHTPVGISGAGDLLGADVLLSLGSYSDHAGEEVGDPPVWTAYPTGTPFFVASTLLHEFGHTFGLGHGGRWEDPNCKPVYTSVMNYLYQLRGQRDNSGKLFLNFSRGTNPAIDEGNLVDAYFPSSALSSRIGWYAPLAGSYRATSVPLPIPASSRCPGTPKLESEVFVRFDAPSTTSVIDWNANGSVEGLPGEGYSLDINFDGRTTAPPAGDPPIGEFLEDYDDWSNLRLNQVGGRRSVGGLFPLFPVPEGCLDVPCLWMGPLSLGASYSDYTASDYAQLEYARSGYGRTGFGRTGFGSDLSRGDLGLGDFGRTGFGRTGFGRTGFGRTGFGRTGFGRTGFGRTGFGAGDSGRGYLGGGDLALNDPNNPGGELNHETATWSSPPALFSACIGVECPGSSPGTYNVRADWTDPTEGGVVSYQLYRVQAAALEAGQVWEPVGGPRSPLDPLLQADCSTVGRYDPSNPSKRCYAVIDDFALMKGLPYIYFADATYDDGLPSDPSDHVLIIGPNHVPVANAQSGVTAEDTALAITLSGGDVDGDNLTYDTTPPTQGGTLSGTAPNLTYTPAANYYGSDSFAFTVNDGTVTSAPATVTITVTAVNDAPVADARSLTTDEDAAKSFTLTGSDVDGDLLTYAVPTPPAHGTLSGTAPNLTYTPAANYNGSDSFAFTVSDGTVTSAPATVTITVTSVNDAPVAVNDSYLMPQSGTALTVAVPGVLLNDTDVDGNPLNPLTAVFGTPPSNGTLALNADGSFTYTPNQPISGSDSFTYRATDGSATSNLATVSIKAYALVGTQNVPPAVIAKSKAGSTVPMKWQFKDGTLVVNSSGVMHTVTVKGPLPGGTTYTFTNTDPGSSSFRYDSTTNTWYFNLQTKNGGVPYPVGDYNVTITPDTPGYLPSPTFVMKLTK